jgi:hypothetical protein
MSKEEALTAIREASAGQAEAYANTAAGSMERVQNAFGNALEDIGGVILPKVTEALGGFADFISSPEFSAGITAIADLVGDTLSTAFTIASDAISAITTLLGPVITAFGDLFGLFQEGGEGVNGLGEVLGNIGEKIGELGGKVLTAITDALPGIIAKLGEWGAAFLGFIVKDVLPFIGQKLTEFGQAVGEWVTGGGLAALVDNLVKWGGAFLGFIAKDVLPFIVGKLGDLLGAIVTWVTGGGLSALIGNLVKWGGAFLGFIAKDVLPFIVTKLGEFASAVFNWLINTALPTAIEKLAEFAQAFLGWIGRDVLPFIGTKLGELWTAIVKWIDETKTKAINAVKAIGKGIVDGIKSGIDAAWQGFLNWLNGILAGLPQVIKDFFGIKSPSKLMAGFGMSIGEGLAVGIEGSIPLVKDAFSHLVGTATGGVSLNAGSAPRPTTGAGGTRAISVGSIVIQGAGGIADPRAFGEQLIDELDRLERMNTRMNMRQPGWA